MAPPFSLAAVLALRQRKEEEEERTLAALATQRAQAGETLRRVEHEMRQWTETRARETGTVRNAAMHQASYARYRMLCEAQAQLLEHIRVLEARRLQQHDAYLAARSGREMLTELQTAQHNAWQAGQQVREQRRLEDIFTARRVRRQSPERR